jgi:hygromycin-B 7''-O-kinase
MTNLKIFETKEEYLSKKSDISFWKVHIAELLESNNLKQSMDNIQPGFNSTYPVFVLDDLVIKFFCYRKNWQLVYQKECAAHQIIAKNPEILAPQIVAFGEEDKNVGSWAYHISTRIVGNSWLNSELTRAQQITVFSELGSQLKMIHALPIDSDLIERFDNFDHLDVIAAAQNSSLPKHLINQIDDFLTAMPPFDCVLVNSDIVLMHVFVNNGHLSGIIDWGDAAITDRHYELGKLCLEFPGDKVLLKSLLEAASWPVTETFAHQALGMALYRQAVGLTQHNTFDAFHKLPGAIEHLERVKTLDDLSKILFEIQ